MNAAQTYRVRLVEQALRESAPCSPAVVAAVVIAIATAPALPALNRRTLQRWIVPASGEARPASSNELSGIMDGWNLPAAGRSLATKAFLFTGWDAEVRHG